MSLISRVLGRLWKLPAPITRDIATERLRIRMRDGVELLADRYYARESTNAPTVLIRTCYGRGAFKFIATVLAERGMQVVMQSCRGTNGSQGTFRPFFDERDDGVDTVEWMERQPWFSGKLALWGASYLGNAAWAIAASRVAPKVNALGLHVTLTNFRDQTYAFDGFTLIGCVGWTMTMVQVINTGGMIGLGALLGRRKAKALTDRASATIPLGKADRVFRPEGVPWWQDWMDHAEPGDPWWEAIDYGAAARSMPPTVMVGGWYDIFLPFQLRDFAAAQNAGRDVRITIGPWTHAAFPGFAESLRQSIELFQERFGIGTPQSAVVNGKPRVRLFLMGAKEWREYPAWPPANTVAQTFFLHSSGDLTASAPVSENESTFDYDPAQPTPAFHGATLEGPEGLRRHGGTGTALGCPGLYVRAGGVGRGRDRTGFRRDLPALEYGAHGSVSVPVRRNAAGPFHECLRWLPAPAPRWSAGQQCPQGHHRLLADRVSFSARAQNAGDRRERGLSALLHATPAAASL